jgi:hypothetical protein
MRMWIAFTSLYRVKRYDLSSGRFAVEAMFCLQLCHESTEIVVEYHRFYSE